MKKFEYKIVTVKAENLYKKTEKSHMEDQFTLWGQEGWDMVKMEAINSGNHVTNGATTKSFVVVFKKELEG